MPTFRGKPARVEPERTWEDCMKGVVFLGDLKLELREFPDPTPGPRDVILEIKASGMCGTDLHTYRAPGGAVAGGIKPRPRAGPPRTRRTRPAPCVYRKPHPY